jgi:tetratricopeptide (TPR) repeat protein
MTADASTTADAHHHARRDLGAPSLVGVAACSRCARSLSKTLSADDSGYSTGVDKAIATPCQGLDIPRVVGGVSQGAAYAVLARTTRSPVIELNHAVAVAMSRGFETGLEQIEQIAATGGLDSYYLYHAARADLLRRLRRNEEALAAYDRALSLSANAVERRYLRRRMTELSNV